MLDPIFYICVLHQSFATTSPPSGGNSGAFLPDIVRCFDKIFVARIKSFEVSRDARFKLGERQQIESKFKKCNILAVYVI